MPVHHMVWIKFNPSTPPERQQHHLDGLRSLAGKVPGILALHVGENFTDRANGFTHGLYVLLESREALQTYAVHDEHVAVAAPLKEDAELMAMDFEG